MKSKRTKRTVAPATMVYATSDARANFATLLQAASTDQTLIAFERFGQVVAVVAPVEAIRVLADENISPAMRTRLRRAARELLGGMAQEETAPVKAVPKKAPPARPKAGKAKPKAGRAKAKG